MALEKIAIALRALQIYGQHAHNNCIGKSFIPDHGMFADSYEAAAADYDSVIERMIGSSGKPVDTISIAADAVKLCGQCSREPGDCNVSFLQGVLKLEMAIATMIDRCVAGEKLPEGTKQLIGDIADRSMSRQYKIRQRLK